jgi:two-component system chemotaxis sensor kinase CheA
MKVAEQPKDHKKSSKPKEIKQLPKEKETIAKISSTIKVDSSKIDTLINLIGELVIANSNVVSKAETLNNKSMMETVSSVSRMVEELREAAMNMRMVPIGETFGRFKRIVRDLARELNKEIELHLIGSETELDKTVVDKIVDPLIHLVRNSVDHGIETKEVRLSKDKPSAGNITLKAFHEAGFIAIQIIDDGKGLDPDFLRKKAIEKGIITADDVLSEKECFELILAAGFSTAEKITSISGRGVGMDVVRRNIEDLKGTISIDSELDKGTTITVKLPLTLAIIDGFLTKVGEKSYIIPLNMIVECIQLTDDYKEQLKENDYINLRGGILSLLDLRDFFNIPKIGSKRENIVIVKFDGKSIGLIVDELKGEFQTVIKPLGKIFQNIKGLGGSTILGGGEVGMILDIPLLIKSVTEVVN